MGTDRYVVMGEHLSRSGASSEAGHSDGPTPGPEGEGTGGNGGCSAGTDPCMMEEQRGWGWQQGSPRDARWSLEHDQGSSH